MRDPARPAARDATDRRVRRLRDLTFEPTAVAWEKISRVTAPTTVRASVLVLAYFAFVSLGLPDGLLGVGWASIHVDLQVPTDAVGFLLFAGTAGYLTSRVAAG